MKKILIIEDAEDIVQSLSDLLIEVGYEVMIAKDGQEGISFAKNKIPDLIICDILMPKLDGYDVLAALKNDNKTQIIPLIYLSARAEKSEIKKGLNIGANGYVVKPYKSKELIDIINRALNEHR